MIEQAKKLLFLAEEDPRYYVTLGKLLKNELTPNSDMQNITAPSKEMKQVFINSLRSNDSFIAKDWLINVFRHFTTEDEHVSIVERMPFAVLAIPTASDKVKEIAIRKQPQIVVNLDNPTEEQINLAVSLDDFVSFLLKTLKKN